MFEWMLQISTSVHKVTEAAIVVKPPVPTLQVASHVSVNRDSLEMDFIVQVSLIILTIDYHCASVSCP